MNNSFYFICPTDCLEHIINKKFKHKNYFYSSLGNSFTYDCKTVKSIKQMIKSHHISEICFMLSTDNKIILDALGSQNFYGIKALKNCYSEITVQKKLAKVSCNGNRSQFSVLSYYLNTKIKELELLLGDDVSIKIRGKIYNKQLGRFRNIHSDLVCLQLHHLN